MRFPDALRERGLDLEMHAADRHSRFRFHLARDGEPVGHGTVFTGARRVRPWIEFHPVTLAPRDDRDRALFEALSDALEPGGHVMVHYLRDSATAEALTADVPPEATPLGFLLWKAGCRWFKDWYFTEGWMEGSQKLQGNLPLDRDHRAEREEEARARLEPFLDREDGFERCKTLAREVLDTL